MSRSPEQGSASLDVAAPPAAVWALVADITRMGEWSPECERAEWENGADGPAVGAHLHGWNRVGDFTWDAEGIVVECEPGAVFAFQVPRGYDGATTWRFEFAANGDGTTVTESFDAPLLNVEGSPSNFEGRYEMLLQGIASTLANIKTAAES